MKTYVFFDIDLTLADSRPVYKKHGKEPNYKKNPKKFNAWLAEIVKPENILPLAVVEPCRTLLNYYVNSTDYEVAYLTARNESLRKLTQQWLVANNMPDLPLFMRPQTNKKENGNFKVDFIKSHTPKKCRVVMVDDDPSGELEKGCKKNNWLFLKVSLD